MRNLLPPAVRAVFLQCLRDKFGRELALFDMDGVICNFEKLAAEHAAKLDITTEEFLSKKMYRYQPQFFMNLEPIDGAIESLNRISKKYEVRILSAPSWNAPLSFTEKRFWVEKHLGKEWEKKMDLSFAKELVMGHYLVDDRFKYGVKNFIGEHIHFGSPTFPGWAETEKYLMSK